MVKITRLTLSSGLADASGNATNQSIPLRGKVLKISLKYDAGISASTTTAIYGGSVNTTIADIEAEGFLVVTGNTDAVYYPENFLVNNSGVQGSVDYSTGNDVHDKFTVFDLIHIQIMNATANKGVTAEIIVEEN